MPRGGKRPGAGRKKGCINKISQDTRERILSEADPIDFLMRVMKGEERFKESVIVEGLPMDVEVRPRIEHRMQAANTLAKKAAPDLKAIEHTGNVDHHHTHEACLDMLEELTEKHASTA